MSTVLTSLPWLDFQPEARHTFLRNCPGTSTGLALTQKVILFCYYISMDFLSRFCCRQQETARKVTFYDETNTLLMQAFLGYEEERSTVDFQTSHAVSKRFCNMSLHTFER